jgi:Flp pilus assembly protein TadG
MSAHHSIAGLAREERGAVLVMFAVFAPVIVLFAAFALDTGNWFLHKRHLQLQADASAFAAVREFQPCINSNIYAKAGEYGGVASVTTPEGGSVTSSTPLYNLQTGGTTQTNLHELINSKTYYSQGSPVDATTEAKPPCEAGMVDVKLTETKLPWYWRAFSSVPYINAHARVEILRQTGGTGFEPLAVAQTAPVAAKAYFVDEDNNDAILAEQALSDLGPNSSGQEVWANPTPLAVQINKPHIGVVIALSGNPKDTKCGDALVVCFDKSATTGPSLLHIQGWSAEKPETGSYKAPMARQVTLQPGTCSDPYFAPSGQGCTIGVTASVDLGKVANPPGVGVNAIVGGTTAAMTYSTTTKKWSVASVAAPKEGSNQVDLQVTCKPKTVGSPCSAEKGEPTATVKNVQRAYMAGESSGPIKGAWVSEPGASEAPVPRTLDADSYQVCEPADGNSCTHKLVVTVDVGASLADAAGFSDPVRTLRFEGTQGVRAGCMPPANSGSEYRTSLETGCLGTYRINTADPECKRTGEPYECFSLGKPGKDTGPTGKGIAARVEKEPQFRTVSCPNNWQNNNSGGVPILPQNDPRIVQLFVMPYGSVDSEGHSLLGNEKVPIQNFAAFYVTSFPNDSCSTDSPKTGNAEITGHFIKYVNPLGETENTKCAETAFGVCVAVLTR